MSDTFAQWKLMIPALLALAAHVGKHAERSTCRIYLKRPLNGLTGARIGFLG
jgi:hypothetical protein